MKKNNRPLLDGISLLCLAAAAVVLLLCRGQSDFTGDRIKNPDAYLLDIEEMNGTDQHTLELQEGDVLQVRFRTARGALSMEIQSPDGTVLYQGNGKETTDFTVNVPEKGLYTVTVEARRASGTVHIRRAGMRNPS
ncbi:MAG: hypothetical protein PUB63_04005 [Clostridia bacterium]|nr:hypothetical protein [Clostridia bacterium]